MIGDLLHVGGCFHQVKEGATAGGAGHVIGAGAARLDCLQYGEGETHWLLHRWQVNCVADAIDQQASGNGCQGQGIPILAEDEGDGLADTAAFLLCLSCEEVFFNQCCKQAVCSGCPNYSAISEAYECIHRKGRDCFAQVFFGVIRAEVDEDQAACRSVDISVSTFDTDNVQGVGIGDLFWVPGPRRGIGPLAVPPQR